MHAASCGVVAVSQLRPCTTSDALWQRKVDATEQEPLLSIYRDQSVTIRDTTNGLWKQNRPHRSVVPQTHGHRGRAARTKPEVLHSVGFGRTERRVTFEAKKSSVVQIAKGSGTGGITTLGDHNSTPLLLFASKRLRCDWSCLSESVQILEGCSEPQRLGFPVPTLTCSLYLVTQRVNAFE